MPRFIVHTTYNPAPLPFGDDEVYDVDGFAVETPAAPLTHDSFGHGVMYAGQTVTAPSAIDALAAYSMSHGFADPRPYIGTDEDFYWTLEDGRVGMVFTNYELTTEEV